MDFKTGGQCDSDAFGAEDWEVLLDCYILQSQVNKIKGPVKQVLKRSVIMLFQLSRILSKKYIRTFS